MNAEPFDDFSGNFAPLRRELWSAENYSYKIFLKSLKPDYRKIGRDIALGYLALAVTLLVTAAMPAIGVWAGVAAGVGAVSVGYWIAYLQQGPCGSGAAVYGRSASQILLWKPGNSRFEDAGAFWTSNCN